MKQAGGAVSAACWAVAVAAALVVGAAAPSPETSKFRDEIGKFVEAFNQGRFEAIGADFNAEMKQGLPGDKLREVFGDLKQKYGTVEEIQPGAPGPAGSMVFPLRFSSGAVLDFEVVMDEKGEVSGLWARPHAGETPGAAPSGATPATAGLGLTPTALSMFACGLFVLLFPPIYAFRLARRWKVGYGIFWAAVGLFWLIQIPHIILLTILTLMAKGMGSSAFLEQNKTWINAVTLGFLAALFERGGQVILFAFLLKGLKTVRQGMLFAFGWGGGEAMVLVGLNLVLAPFLVLLVPVVQSADPSAGAQFQQVVEQMTAVPWFSPLIPVMERTSAVIFHLLAGLLVFLAVRYRRPAYFWVAFLLHFLMDGIATIAAGWAGLDLSPILPRLLIFEFSLLAFSLCLIPFIRSLFRQYSLKEQPVPVADLPPPPAP